MKPGFEKKISWSLELTGFNNVEQTLETVQSHPISVDKTNQ